ncbi:DNRLRE domain-containing protein, partial [Lachnoclostridium sp. 210928-DFI.6.3]|nr:DNRLRE domain-containing protein [Lachnoclostridium sp. 210928-DFI.6.3]
MNGVNETNKTNTSNELFTADKIEAVKQEGRSLVRECIKERSRFSRVFETKNGEKAAVIYPKAVHFKKDDAWEVIDNTLVLSKDQLAYENAQGRMKVRIARMPKQTDHKKKMMLFNLEEKQNARSAQQDQTEEKSGIIELASVEKDGFTISWGLKTQEEKSAVLSQVNESEVQTEFKPNPVSIQTAEEKLLKLSKLSSAGYFREILPGMDIRYRLESEVMKEEIILKKKEAAAETITFVMKHPGLSMHVLADGSVAMCKTQRECAEDFPENAENLSGNAVFFLDAPILFDKNGEVVKAAYQIEKGQGISEITIKMDASWLMDEGRAYPVTIDPTVRIEKKQTTIDDAFVRSKDPNSSYGYNFSELEVGRNRPYQVCRTFLKFNKLPKLEKGAVITDARLNLYQYQFSADNGQGFRVSAHEVTGAWDQRTL